MNEYFLHGCNHDLQLFVVYNLDLHLACIQNTLKNSGF